MSPLNVRLVFLKEMRDTLRDRRTLFISIVLPILLYPVLMIGFSQVLILKARDIAARKQPVAVRGDGKAVTLVARLSAEAEEAKIRIVASEDPEADLAAEKLEAWVEPADDFDERIARGEQGEVTIHFDSTRDASAAARQKISGVLRGLGREVLSDRGLSEADIEPVKIAVADRASTEQRGAKQLGPTLALFLVVMALSGAFYPAVDIMAGEKERGTMETLLVCPARRTEIVLGKYLTVLTMTVMTALLNFASMALTFSYFAGMIPARGGGMALSISPTVGLVIVLALLPLAGLFAAVALALSTFARTYKEGQHYLTPLFVAVMPLAMIALIPETRLETFRLVPVAGVVLLVRDLLLGQAAGPDLFLVLASTLAVAGIAIAWTVSMFNREDVLFRDPGGAEFTLFRRAVRREGAPSPGQAMLLSAVSLALVYLLLPRVAKGSPGTAFLVQQLGLTLGLVLLAVWWYRVDPRRTLSLRRPRREAWLAVLLGAPSVLVLTLFLASLAGLATSQDESMKELEEQLERIVTSIGLPLLVLIPPVVEEIFFRGFVLSAFRTRSTTVVAVLLTALIFAVFHMEPAKLLTTGLIGIWLGYVVVATGSIYPAILAHLLNNAIPLLLVGDGESLKLSGAWVPVALAGLAAALIVLERIRRGAAPPEKR